MNQPPSDDAAAADSRHDDARDFERFAREQDPLDLDAATWVARKRNGLDAAAEAEWRAWLAADPRHAAAYEDMDGTFGRVRAVPRDHVGVAPAGPAPASAGSHRPAARPEPRRHPASAGRRAWMVGIGRLLPQAGAAALAFGAVGGGWIGWQRWQREPTFEQTFATTRGEQSTTPLPDGSLLMLDTATCAEVRLYRDRREVRLTEGQALFTVQADVQRPFHVLAGALRVTVVGTRFAVRHTQAGLGAGDTVVAVEEGRVQVRRAADIASGMDARQPFDVSDADDAAPSVLLSAGQTVTSDDAGRLGPVASLPGGAVAAWRHGRIDFDDTPLGQALAEFERYGHTGLVIHDPTVAAMRVGGSHGVRQSRSFADALPQLLPVRLERRGGAIEIVAR